MEIIQGNRLARPTTLPPGQLSWQLAAWWVGCQSFQDIWFPSCSPGELLASQALQLAAPQALQLGWGLPGVTEIKFSCWSLCWLGSGSIFILETLKCSQCFGSLDNINISLLQEQKSVKTCSVTIRILVFLLLWYWFSFTKVLFFVPNQDEEKRKTLWISCRKLIPFPYHVSGRKTSWFQRLEKIRSLLRTASVKDCLFNFYAERLLFQGTFSKIPGGFVVLK